MFVLPQIKLFKCSLHVLSIMENFFSGSVSIMMFDLRKKKAWYPKEVQSSSSISKNLLQINNQRVNLKHKTFRNTFGFFCLQTADFKLVSLKMKMGWCIDMDEDDFVIKIIIHFI